MTESKETPPPLSRTRDHQVGLPARRAAVTLLDAVLQKKQPLDDMLGRSRDKGVMFDLPVRDRALSRAIVGTSLRRRGQIDHVLNHFLERGLRSHRVEPRRGTGQYAGLALGTPCAVLGRGASSCDCRVTSGGAAARPHRKIRAHRMGGTALGPHPAVRRHPPSAEGPRR